LSLDWPSDLVFSAVHHMAGFSSSVSCTFIKSSLPVIVLITSVRRWVCEACHVMTVPPLTFPLVERKTRIVPPPAADGRHEVLKANKQKKRMNLQDRTEYSSASKSNWRKKNEKENFLTRPRFAGTRCYKLFSTWESWETFRVPSRYFKKGGGNDDAYGTFAFTFFLLELKRRRAPRCLYCFVFRAATYTTGRKRCGYSTPYLSSFCHHLQG
jgi:hypothetical protein